MLSLLGVGYPLIEFLFTGRGAFGDLVDGLILTPIYYHPDLGQDLTFSQPNSPTTVLLYTIFRFFAPSLAATNWLTVNWNSIFLLLTSFLLIIAFLVRKISDTRLTSILLVFSYPMLFLFGRANPDIYCLIFFIMFIMSFEKEKYVLCALLIAIIGAIKLPFFFLSLVFIFVKKIKVFVSSVVLLPIFFYSPLLLFGYPFFSQITSISNVAKNYHRDYVLGEAGSMFNNSLFGLLKIINYIFMQKKDLTAGDLLIVNERLVELHNFLVILTLLAFAIFVMKLEVLKSNEKLDRNQLLRVILILISLSILLPYVSAEYRLSLLVPPIAVLIRRKEFDTVSAVLVGFLFLPKSLYVIGFENEFMGTHFLSSVVNPVILIVLIVHQARLVWISKPKAIRQVKKGIN